MSADNCYCGDVGCTGKVGYGIGIWGIPEEIPSAAGPVCPLCGRGRDVWLAPDESPCKCKPEKDA